MRIAVADIEVAVDVAGTMGPPIVLLHGLGGSRKTWEDLLPPLALGARVFAPDLRGCGETTRGDQPWSLARAADDVAAVVAALGLSGVIVVGHSLGGVIAQELLCRRPSWIAGAVLISTSSRVGEEATRKWQRIADLVADQGIPDSPSAQARAFAETFAALHRDVVARHAAIAAATDRRVYAEMARAASFYDYTEALASIACPVLVLQGLADRLTRPGGSVLLARAIAGNSTLEMIEEAGHNLPVEMPQRASALLLAFAARVSAAT